MSVTLSATRWWVVSHSPFFLKDQASSIFECCFVSMKIWLVWLHVFPVGEVQGCLWMLWCGNVILLTVSFLDMAEFTPLTALSLIILCTPSFPVISLKILSRFWGVTKDCLNWWMDLLTTYTHHSEIQAVTLLLLISTIHKSPQHPLSLFPACCVFISHSLATASSSGDSSASCTQVLSLQPCMQNCLSTDNCQAAGCFTPTS
jgi:hypothetical protein